MPSRIQEDDEDRERGWEPPTSEIMKVARKTSGAYEIDVRAGFERAVREAIENAMRCYRAASKASDAGDEAEAQGLCEIAEQSIDLAHDLLCQIESL